jgi:hypothetical protein
MKREYTIEQVDAWGEALLRQAELDPSQRKVDMKAAIGRLKEKIAVAQQRGYSLAQIAETLRTAGLPIAAQTLKKHLEPAKKVGRKSAARSSGTPAPIQMTASRLPPPVRATQTDPSAAPGARLAPAQSPGSGLASRLLPAERGRL